MEMTCSSISRSRLSIMRSESTTSSATFGSRRSSASSDLPKQLLGKPAHLRDLLVEQCELFLV